MEGGVPICRICHFIGSDLRFLGCGCTLHAVSEIRTSERLFTSTRIRAHRTRAKNMTKHCWSSLFHSNAFISVIWLYLLMDMFPLFDFFGTQTNNRDAFPWISLCLEIQTRTLLLLLEGFVLVVKPLPSMGSKSSQWRSNSWTAPRKSEGKPVRTRLPQSQQQLLLLLLSQHVPRFKQKPRTCSLRPARRYRHRSVNWINVPVDGRMKKPISWTF
jgi:hypothetical protein